MAFRNGIVADTLRKAGLSYSVIFGLQLPQIAQIARQLPVDQDLAMKLWDDENVRESRLLACWLFNPDETLFDTALKLASSVKSREESDILSFRLLRRLPYAQQLAESLSGYPAEALQRNLDNM